MGIHLTTVACNNCGAALSVQEQTRFVTCAQCGSQLAVHRTADSAFTEILGAIHADTRQIATEIQLVRLQNELERVDREWEAWRSSHLVNGLIPDRGTAIAKGVATAVIALIATTATALNDLPIAVPTVVFLIGTALCAFTTLAGIAQADAYARAKAAYDRKRSRILMQLNGQPVT